MAYELDLIQAWNAIAPLIKGTPQREQHEAALAASEAQTGYTKGLRERMASMTPAEVAQIMAQTGLTGAQTASAQGTERRTEAAFPWEQALRKLEVETAPMRNEVTLGLGRAQTNEAEGRASLLGAEAAAVPKRTALEERKVIQEGTLGQGALDQRRSEMYADLLQGSQYALNPNQQLIEELYRKVNLPPPVPGTQVGGVDDAKIGAAAAQVAAEQRRQADPILQQLIGLEQEQQFGGVFNQQSPQGPRPGSEKTSAYNLPAYPTKQAPRQAAKPQGSKYQPAYQPGVSKPETQMPETRALQQVWQVIRNIMAHGGVR